MRRNNTVNSYIFVINAEIYKKLEITKFDFQKLRASKRYKFYVEPSDCNSDIVILIDRLIWFKFLKLYFGLTEVHIILKYASRLLYCKINKRKCGHYSECTKLTQKVIIATKVLLRIKICTLKLTMIMYMVYI